MKKGQNGFTLVEVILATMIIMVLAAISIPLYNDFQNENALKTQTKEAVNLLRLAQQRARTKENNSHWGVFFSHGLGKDYTLYSGNDFASRNSVYDEMHKFPIVLDLSGTTDINFESSGKPNAQATVVFSLPTGKQKVISISSFGNIEEQ